MKFHTRGWAVAAAVALVGSVASTAMAIESFQERFEWGDMSKPTTLQGRVIVLDPYDEAVWINVAVFGGNAESGLFWQKIHPGKNLKFYADKGAWEELKKMGRVHAGPAAAKEVPPGSTTDLIEFTVTETEQNHRVISSVKKLPENAGTPGKTVSISALRLKECQGKNQVTDTGCYAAIQKLNTSPKTPDGALLPMQYDVLLPGGKPLAGLVPWTAKYNEGK
ncbi:conserved exported protein of unknown function [Nitrospira sp. KM1]|uniref:hypothetical protein n=1 Tax=Nitrospira sp. KM1 TaxID=1936990 RepID=UPI0013A72645|nr:hypothetical protein [Nitrospira sp. KM1]BCA55001.1 conserved exported protein of unknown function [Nitrospira sp. KM1]